MTGLALADAAESLVGTPFRLHGRDPLTGLDCIGVLAVSLRAIGREAALPNGYALRCRGIAGLDRLARDAGLSPDDAAIAPGDILLCRPSPCQFHLLVAGRNDRLIHAHAGLRRVIRSPGPVGWPITAKWRLQDQKS